jgi:hypothetical protein
MRTKKVSIQGLTDYILGADSSSTIESSTTDDLAEGSTNLYYTDARVDSNFAQKSTDDLAEGSTNLYYTTARFDSDFAAHDPSDHLDSEHAWNVAEHAALQASIDSNEARNAAEHAALQASIDSLDSDLSDTSAIQASLDSEHAWNVAEHNALQSSIDSMQSSIDSNEAQNATEHVELGQRIDNLTTDSVAEGSNLYYTDARVDARIDVAIDSDFLDERMPIDNLSDVQINFPTLDATDVLQWNGSVWTNTNIGIATTVTFRGTTDATVETAPSADNGDLYINTSSGTAVASWVGLTSVDSGDGLVWDEDDTSWRNVGHINSGSIVRVQPGTGIEVDETDPARPTVSINKTVTDGWYYTQSQVDSDLAGYLPLTGGTVTGSVIVEGEVASSIVSSLTGEDLRLQKSGSSGIILSSSVTEFSNRPARYNYLASQSAGNHEYDLIHKAYLDATVDSEHAWNVAEHAALDSGKVSKSGDAMSGTLAFNGAHQTIMTIDPDSAQHIDLFNNNPSASDVTVRLTGGSSGNSLKIRGTESEFLPFGKIVYRRSTDTVGAGDIQANLGGSRDPSEITQWKLSFTSRPDGNTINTPTIGTIIRLYKAGQYADYGVSSVTVDGSFWVMDVNHIQTVGSGMTFFTQDNLDVETKDSSTVNVDMVSFNADASIDYNVNISMNSHRITDVADAVDSYDAVNKRMLDSAFANISFDQMDSSQFVDVTGDTMTGKLSLPEVRMYRDSSNAFRSAVTFAGGSDSDFDLEMKTEANFTDAWMRHLSTKTGQSLRAVEYANGRWVAVSISKNDDFEGIIYSDDGINWTTATTAHEKSGYYDVATDGNGTWVTVIYSFTNKILYSTDNAETWQEATGYAPGDGNDYGGYSAVTYGDGKFVAVTSRGTYQVSTSTDGINWNNHNALAAEFQDIAYGNGTFVAVAYDDFPTNNGFVIYSTDGVNWNTATAGVEENQWFGITYGDGKFVAVSSDGTNRVMYSTDGINWTAASAASEKRWVSVAYGNGLWVAGSRESSGSSKIMVSKDGINWTLVNRQFKSSMWGAAFSPLDNSFLLSVDDGSFQRLVWDKHQVGLYFDDELVATEQNLQPMFQKLGDLETETNELLHKSKRNMVKEEFKIADSDTNDVFISVSNGSLGLYHVKYPNMDHHATNKQYVDSALNAITAGVSDSDKVNKSGDTMTGNLIFDSGNSIYVNNGNIEVYDQGKIRTNKISSVGDSNLTIQRNTSAAIQIISGANKNFQKATYNADYGVTDDLDIPHKKYVDSAIAALSSEDADLGQRIDNLTTDSVAEGSNLYYTDARVDSNFAQKSTDDLAEGSTNLFYTDARVETFVDSAYVQARVNFDSAGVVYINKDAPTAPNMGQQWLETPDSGDAVMWIWDGVYWLESPTGRDGAAGRDGVDGSSIASTDDLAEGSTNLYYTDARADVRATLIVNNATTDNIDEGSNNLYFTDERVETVVDSAYVNALISIPTGFDSADAISAVTSSTLDMGGNKVLFSNVYSAEGDLPSATDNHGMFAHVHGTGAGYFAHAGNWVRLANASEIVSAPIDTVNGQTGTVVLDAADVGALADTTSYVSSVNGSTGAVTVSTFSGAYDDLTGKPTLYTGSDAVKTSGAQDVGGIKRFTSELRCTSNIVAYYSDERLKNVVGSIEDPIEKVKSIETFYYTPNDKAHELGYEGDKKEVGVSAQSVMEVVPEVIHRAPVDDDGEGGSVSGEEYLTVDYARLVPLLIESIKQLSAEIEELKK